MQWQAVQAAVLRFQEIDGKAYGQMILQLPEDERAAKRALAYLETQNVHTEEVDANAAV